MKRTGLIACLLAVSALLPYSDGQLSLDADCEASIELQDQTCAWIEDCTRQQCSQTCILNTRTNENQATLNSRQYGEDSWQMCPELAFWVNITRPGAGRESTNRRLMEDQDESRATEIIRRYLAIQKSHEERMHAVHALNSMREEESFSLRQLSDFNDVTLESVPDELALDCPTEDLIDQGASELISVGVRLENIAKEFLQQGFVSAENQDFDILDNPNKWLVLMEYFLDPVKLKDYILNKCEEQLEFNGFAQITAAAFYVKSNISDTGPDTVMRICKDKAGAWDSYHQSYPRIANACEPSFGSPCYPPVTWQNVVDNQQCSEEYTSMFNVSVPETLDEVAAVNQEIDIACRAITDENECTTDPPQEVKDLGQKAAHLMSTIPFRSNHPLAPQMFENQLVPDPAAAAAPADAPDEAPEPSGPEPCEGGCGEGGGDEGGTVNTGLVVGPIAAAVALVLLGVLVAVFVKRQRQKKAKRQQMAAGGDPNATPFTDAQAPGLYPTKGGPASPPEGGTLAPGGGASWPNRSSFVSMHSMHGAPSLHAAQSMHGTDHTDTSANGGGAPSMVSSVSTMHTPPAPSMIGSMHAPSMHGSMHAPRQLQPQPSFMNGHGPTELNVHVCQALDYMHTNRHLLADRYGLLSPQDRSFGSFGVLQLATITRQPDAVAIKIFTNAAGFANEERAYGIKSVADAVGTCPSFMRNADRAAVMPSGWPFPPFTIAEKGQPLNTWMSSYSADPITSMQVLGQVLKTVKALHEAGYAHRNIKPSNILQREKQHDWMLCDFSASCPIGATAPLPASPASVAYAAPELAAAAATAFGALPSAVATTEADMWALGIVAFELLCNERAFPEGTPPEAILSTLRGEAPLPWEDGAAGADARREQLRGLRRLVLPCLSRDPSQRPSAKSVLASWHNMFDDMKTRGTFESDDAQHGGSTRDPTATV